MKVKKASQVEWKAFTEQCESATFFHTLDWYLVWKTYKGYELETLLFEFESGHKVLLPLASLKQTKGLTKFYMSSPAGTYGGFLTKNELLEAEKQQLRKYLKKKKWITIRENPFKNQSILNDWTESGFSQVLSLDRSMDIILKTWTKGHASAFKKAKREGLQFKIAEDMADWKIYFQIYQKTLERWGNKKTSEYEWLLFQQLSYLPKTNCSLWLADYNGKVISGCLCFYYNQHVVYWHGASLSTFFYLKPVHFLQYHIINDAIQKNYQWYDFNPSGGHEGVIKFKKGFGTEKQVTQLMEKVPLFISFLKFLRKK